MKWGWSVLVVAATTVVVVSCSSSSTSTGNGSGAISCAWCCSASPTVTCDCIVTTPSCPSSPPATCGSACRGTCVFGRCDEGNQPPGVDSGRPPRDASSSDGALECGGDAAELCGGIDMLTDVPCDVWADCAAQECTSAPGYPQAVACCRAGKLDSAVSACQKTEADCEQACVDQPGGATTQCIGACTTGFRSCIDKTCSGAGAAYK